MAARRTFYHTTKTKDFVITTPNILGAVVINYGTKDIIVEGQRVPANQWWRLPDGSGIPMVKDFDIEVIFTDNTATDNRVYYAVTALIDVPEDQC